jgi:hypothetical protein
MKTNLPLYDHIMLVYLVLSVFTLGHKTKYIYFLILQVEVTGT